MRVPHARRSRLPAWLLHIPLNHNRSRCFDLPNIYQHRLSAVFNLSTHTWAHRCENNVSNLYYTLRVRCSDSDNWRWCICILERGAFTRYDGPCLTNHLGTCWNGNRRRNDVRPRVEEYNFTARELCKISLFIWVKKVQKYFTNLFEYGRDGGSVICDSVAFCTIVFDADELARGKGGILRMCTAEYFSSWVQQRRRFACTNNRSLCKGSRPTGTMEYVSLAPGVNCCSTSGKHRFAGGFYTNGNGDVGKSCIIDDQRSIKCSITG